MSADPLRDFVDSTGVKDAYGLKCAIYDVVKRFKQHEAKEQARALHLAQASDEYFVGWKIAEMTVGGKIPPRDGIHEYDARVESGDMILAKYSSRPHIRVILANAAGTLFKVGVVVDYRQHLSHNQITFNNFRLSVGVDVIPPEAVHEEERKVVINSLFDYLYKHHYRFVKELEFRFSDLRALVIFYSKPESP